MQTEWVSVRPGLRSEVSSRLCLPFSGGTVGGPEHTGSISSQVPQCQLWGTTRKEKKSLCGERERRGYLAASLSQRLNNEGIEDWGCFTCKYEPCLHKL